MRVHVYEPVDCKQTRRRKQYRHYVYDGTYLVSEALVRCDCVQGGCDNYLILDEPDTSANIKIAADLLFTKLYKTDKTHGNHENK